MCSKTNKRIHVSKFLLRKEILMKRIVSLITLVAMLFSIMLSSSVFAESDTKLELKDAIEIAKRSFGIDTTNYEFNSNYSENNDGKRLWYLYWSSKDGSGGSINITVNADTGEIVNMSRWDSGTAAPGRIPKYSKEAALKAAEDIARKLNPEKYKHTFLVDQDKYPIYRPYYSPEVYSFYFMRRVDGIDFQDNGIMINVDKNTLSARYYSLEWDDNAPIPDAKKAISSEAAKKIFQEKLGIELSYHMIYTNSSAEPKLMLVYNLENGNRPIDAITGEVIKNPYYGPMYAANEKLARGAGGGMNYAPTPEEQRVIDDASKYISEEKAIEALKKYVDIDEKYTLQHKSLNGSSKYNNANWSFSWNYTEKESNKYSSIYAAVDAVTGEIRNFNVYDNEYDLKKPGTPKYTKEQSRAIAEKFLAEIQPVKFKDSEYREQYYDYIMKTEDIINYGFSYIRKVNGISFPSNSLIVNVNAYTGKVTSYSMNWNDMDFPDAKDTISLDEAYKILYNKHDLKLKYIRMYDYEKNDGKQSVRLVYMLDNLSGMIDAKTGRFVDHNGNPIKETTKKDFTDIKGHKYENDIQLLIELGIIDEAGDKFNPDSSILQKDFIKMLMKSLQPEYYPVIYAEDDEKVYERYYDMAIQQNILPKDKKNPEAAVAKLEASKLLVNALGLGYVADLSTIFSLDVKDVKFIAEENKGYAAIAAGLGLVSTAGGRFEPEVKLTRAETAAMLVRFLKIDKTPKDFIQKGLLK